MNFREVILNLWYVRDEEGMIYSLRVKAYTAWHATVGSFL